MIFKIEHCFYLGFGRHVKLWVPVVIHRSLTVVTGIQKLESLATSLTKGYRVA